MLALEAARGCTSLGQTVPPSEAEVAPTTADARGISVVWVFL